MVYYQNVRGLRTKLTEFSRKVALNDFSIILLTETWLTSDFSDAELGLSNYDRDVELTGKTRGGGTLIAIHKTLESCVLKPPNRNKNVIYISES